jgi:hypothetical protein
MARQIWVGGGYGVLYEDGTEEYWVGSSAGVINENQPSGGGATPYPLLKHTIKPYLHNLVR